MADQDNAPFKADGPLAEVMQAALELPAETQGRQNLLRAIAKARADHAAPTDNTALVEAEKRGMQKVLSHFRECAEHDQGGLDYSSLVGIPICNADELASEVAFYERAARHVQDVLDRAALANREALPAAQVPTCTGVKDKDGNVLFLGDRVRYRKEGCHTKKEYWNPEYEIIWKAPGFTLKHVGGGKDEGSCDFMLRCGGGNGVLELVKRGPYAAPPPACQQEAVTVADAAAVILRAIERAQIDMTILRKFMNGELCTALRALKGSDANG